MQAFRLYRRTEEVKLKYCSQQSTLRGKLEQQLVGGYDSGLKSKVKELNDVRKPQAFEYATAVDLDGALADTKGFAYLFQRLSPDECFKDLPLTRGQLVKRRLVVSHRTTGYRAVAVEQDLKGIMIEKRLPRGEE